MIIELVSPQKVIMEELASGKHNQESIALTYAFIIRQEAHTADWVAINKAIENRWSLAGLKRVKKMAWKYV